MAKKKKKSKAKTPKGKKIVIDPKKFKDLMKSPVQLPPESTRSGPCGGCDVRMD